MEDLEQINQLTMRLSQTDQELSSLRNTDPRDKLAQGEDQVCFQLEFERQDGREMDVVATWDELLEYFFRNGTRCHNPYDVFKKFAADTKGNLELQKHSLLKAVNQIDVQFSGLGYIDINHVGGITWVLTEKGKIRRALIVGQVRH